MFCLTSFPLALPVLLLLLLLVVPAEVPVAAAPAGFLPAVRGGGGPVIRWQDRNQWRGLISEGLGRNSIEIFWLDLRLEKPIEFWLEIP